MTHAEVVRHIDGGDGEAPGHVAVVAHRKGGESGRGNTDEVRALGGVQRDGVPEAWRCVDR